jgi:hypothetical protein
MASGGGGGGGSRSRSERKRGSSSTPPSSVKVDASGTAAVAAPLPETKVVAVELPRERTKGERPDPVPGMARAASIVCAEVDRHICFSLVRLPGMPPLEPCRVPLDDDATVADLVEYLREQRGCLVFGVDKPLDQRLKPVRFLALVVDYQPLTLHLEGRLLRDCARLRRPPFATLADAVKFRAEWDRASPRSASSEAMRDRMATAIEFVYYRYLMLQHLAVAGRWCVPPPSTSASDYVNRLLAVQRAAYDFKATGRWKGADATEKNAWSALLGHALDGLALATDRCAAVVLGVPAASCDCRHVPASAAAAAAEKPLALPSA